MRIFKGKDELITYFRENKFPGRSLGFVPTMGALHEGHASLIRKAVAENDDVVVSIFVNPTQFRPGEDFNKYPRTPEQDIETVKTSGAHFVFLPANEEMYPGSVNEISFRIHSLNRHLCGESRPGHFEGVLQVVLKLFNIVQPDKAYFGLKDYQQYVIIRRMVEEFFLPVEIVGCPIVREEDGLAMSSRNRYLNDAERKQALFLNEALKAVNEKVEEGMTAEALKSLILAKAAEYPLVKTDYFEIVDGDTLQPLDNVHSKDSPVALLAAWVGETRLIDNMFLFL